MTSLRRKFAALATVATAAAGAITAIAPLTPTTAAPLFGQKDVDQNKFVAIAAPFGERNHQLLVLEQISSDRSCWNESGNAPVVVDPLLTTFDFTGICSRSTDSNGYSIRVDGEDLGLQYSLRVVERDGDLKLLGRPFQLGSGSELEIGSARGSADGFVKLNLNPGWEFAKRTYQGQTLGHVYLAYNSALPGLVPGGDGGQTSFVFGDIANDIYAMDIEAAVDRGFVAGFSEDNTFRPGQTLTREQLVSMVVEALNTLPDADMTLSATGNNPYPDVDGSRWSAAKIKFARDNNIISGYQDGTFRPTQTVTRAEMMAILRRAAEYSQGAQSNVALWPTQDAMTFSDINGHWASRVVTQMSSYCGVASPLNETGTAFFPNSATQRNYAASATLRMLDCAEGAATEETATASRTGGNAGSR
ncbi:MAG: DUF3747 domain-containing protein [Elainellaceae cyanobacterium]